MVAPEVISITKGFKWHARDADRRCSPWDKVLKCFLDFFRFGM